MSKTKRLIEEKESFKEDFYDDYGFYPPEDWKEDFYDDYGFYPPEDWDEDKVKAYEEMVEKTGGLDAEILYWESLM